MISGVTEEGQKGNLWAKGGCGAVHPAGADRLRTHTASASPCVLDAGNGWDGRPAKMDYKGNLCAHESLGTGDPEGDSSHVEYPRATYHRVSL